MRKSIFCIILCLLLVAFVLSLALGWHEADVQGWWPLALAVGALVASTYAALFSLLLPPDLSRRSVLAAVVLNASVALLLVVHAASFYWLPVDWLAVNEGRLELTWFQTLVHRAVSPYLIVFTGLIFPMWIRFKQTLSST
ncbi:MAG: hypothetical protein ING40_15725 [Burkholderiales bacterium]|nr:hypothetical protein [Burkholderiales bacterium]